MKQRISKLATNGRLAEITDEEGLAEIVGASDSEE